MPERAVFKILLPFRVCTNPYIAYNFAEMAEATPVSALVATGSNLRQ